MRHTATMTTQHRRFRAEWVALGLLLLLLAGVLAGALYRVHRVAEAAESERLQVQARVIDENLVGQLEGAEKALTGIAADLRGLDATLDEPALTAKLSLLASAMPGISSMLVQDASGTIVASSLKGLTGKNFNLREYFDVPRRRMDPAMFHISPPFRSVLGNFVMVVSRVLTDSQGQFIGVATATLDAAYFSVLLRSVLYAPDMHTALIHHDGKVFLNMPLDAKVLGVDLSSAADSMFSRHRHSGGSANLYTGRALAVPEDRMVVMRTMDRPELHLDKPLVVSVSRTLDAIYAPWRYLAWLLGGALAMLAPVAAVCLGLSQRRRRAFAEVEAAMANERRAGAERLDLALRSADLGLWDLHVPSNQFVVSARERAMLGYTDQDALPQGKAWRALVHPDDWAHVDAAIVPHLRGQTASYGCEHRMRHRDGHYLWISNRAMVVERDADGAPVRIVGTHLDITERKLTESRLAQAAAHLRQSEAELRLVTDHMPALVSRLDTEQCFRFANRAYADWLHMDPASLIGRSLVEVYGEQAYAGFRQHIERALTGDTVCYERELTTPEGTRQIELTLVPQFGANDSVNGLFVLAIDISARHQAQAQRALSEERLSLALEGSNLALFDWDIPAGMLYHSAQAAAMRGEPAVETMTPISAQHRFVHPDDLDHVVAQMKAAVSGKTPLYLAEFRLKRHSGGWFWVRARGRVVHRDAAGRALRLAGTYADINDSKIAEGQLRRLAEIDSLTGLPNRALFQDRLQQAMARAARGQPMALLFLDIDYFKSVNDSLGHEAGDTLLQVFAERMQQTVRMSDTVARLSGDEFTIILEALHDLGDAKMLAHKLVEALRQPLALAGQTVQVSVSIGVALCRPGESDDAALLRRADAALYEAKRRGRDRFFCDEPDGLSPSLPLAVARRGANLGAEHDLAVTSVVASPQD